MSIALFSAAKLLATHPALPLTSLLAWLWRTRTAVPTNTVQNTAPSHTPPYPPLRVWRHVDSGQPGTASMRLVISGRMSEVCAELDRLAELEARRHS